MQAEINKKRYSKLYPDVPIWLRLTESEPKSENRGGKRTTKLLINYKGVEFVFSSQAEASRELDIYKATIYKAIKEQRRVGDVYYAKLLSGDKLRVIFNGIEYIFDSANDACNELAITHKTIQRAIRRSDKESYLYAEYIIKKR